MEQTETSETLSIAQCIYLYYKNYHEQRGLNMQGMAFGKERSHMLPTWTNLEDTVPGGKGQFPQAFMYHWHI